MIVRKLHLYCCACGEDWEQIIDPDDESDFKCPRCPWQTMVCSADAKPETLKQLKRDDDYD